MSNTPNLDKILRLSSSHASRQPRDKGGQWTSGGGSALPGSSGGAGGWKEVPHIAIRDKQNGLRTLEHPSGLKLVTSSIMPWVVMDKGGATLKTLKVFDTNAVGKAVAEADDWIAAGKPRTGFSVSDVADSVFGKPKGKSK